MLTAEKYAALAEQYRPKEEPTQEEQRIVHLYIMRAVQQGAHSAILWERSETEDNRLTYHIVKNYQSYFESLGFAIGELYPDIIFLGW